MERIRVIIELFFKIGMFLITIFLYKYGLLNDEIIQRNLEISTFAWRDF